MNIWKFYFFFYWLEGSMSPPPVTRERRLSDESNATADLTNASPLGDYKHLDSRVPNGDLQQDIMEEGPDTDFG